jgi:hypothetical protein
MLILKKLMFVKFLKFNLKNVHFILRELFLVNKIFKNK